MPFRSNASKHLAELFGVLSNPNRVRLVEELSRHGELGVSALETELGISHSAVSQHLSLLRAHRMVTERRDGRQVFYRLSNESLATWILQGLDYLEREFQADPLKKDLEQAKMYWARAARPRSVAKTAR